MTSSTGSKDHASLPDIYTIAMESNGYEPLAREITIDALSADEQQLLGQILSMLDSTLDESDIPLEATQLVEFTDPEDATSMIVVLVVVDLNFNQANDYWDRAAASWQQWQKTLPDDQQALVRNRFTLEVRWRESEDSR